MYGRVCSCHACSLLLVCRPHQDRVALPCPGHTVFVTPDIPGHECTLPHKGTSGSGGRTPVHIHMFPISKFRPRFDHLSLHCPLHLCLFACDPNLPLHALFAFSPLPPFPPLPYPFLLTPLALCPWFHMTKPAPAYLFCTLFPLPLFRLCTPFPSSHLCLRTPAAPPTPLRCPCASDVI